MSDQLTADVDGAVTGAVDAFDQLIDKIKDASPFKGSTVYPVTDSDLELMRRAYHRMADLARLA